MMQYMNYYQPQFIDLGIKSFQEGALLDYIMKAFGRADTITINEIEYVKLHPNKIMDDIPLLGITTSNGLNKHISKLIKNGLIIKKVMGNSPYYAATEKLKNYYKVGGKQMDRQVLTNGPTGTNVCSYNSNMLDNNINIDYLYISVDQLKKKNKDIKKALIDLLSLYEEKTDLYDTPVEQIIDLWNSYNKDYQLPIVRPNKTITDIWNNFKKKYTKAEFNLSLKNYLKDIQERNPAKDYSKHRFKLYEFLKQENGAKKFMSDG